ncbi:MAG: TerB family tellurite resistance protein [Prevotellaceae bacterium]|jgi:DnaJ-domain-containing protein 1|nr:TerB family tellurite resistance protein [Prevotellaceae bacterium]
MDEKIKQHFLGLYQMIISDTEVHPKELELLYQIGREKGVSEQEIQNAILSPNSLFLSADLLNNDEKIEYLFDLARMAWADGVLDDSEKVSLNNACKRLGFSSEYSEEISTFLLEQAKDNKNIKDVLEIIKNL